MAVLSVVAGDEIVEVAALQWIFFKGEVFVGAQVVNPEPVRPEFFRGGFAVEEEDVGLALGVEDAANTDQGIPTGKARWCGTSSRSQHARTHVAQ